MQAFHVYNTSCLILWMLSIEFEIVCNQSVRPKVGKRSKKKNGDKSNTAGKDGTVDTFSNPIVSVFCPECQGTGVNIEGDELEKTPASHSEVWFLSLDGAIEIFLCSFCALCQQGQQTFPPVK